VNALAIDYGMYPGTGERHSLRLPNTVMVSYLTAEGSTPIPLSLGSDFVFCWPTGPVLSVPPVHSLVRDSLGFIQSWATMPINSEDEAIVDRLVSARIGEIRGKSLRRRV
jgi:hypothetical protein